jgi:hypothetical protein
MPLDPKVLAEFENSCDEADNDLQLKYEKMTPEQRQGADTFLAWYKMWFGKCTYTHIGKHLKEFRFH